MRFRYRIALLIAALIACVLSVGVASALAAPGGNGSGSTATAGPGNSGQGCDGTHNSDTGHGANQSGPYDNTCTGAPSLNGNGGGQATGKPCAGCVGNADDKNPKGQMPNGTDHNAGYECDRNHGIGKTNPAHTGCTQSSNPPPSGCPAGTNCGEKCPDGSTPVNGKCDHKNPGCPEQGNCDHKQTTTPPPTKSETPPPPQQAVLGTKKESGTTPTPAPPKSTTTPAPPKSTTTPAAPKSEVLGESGAGTTPPAPATAAQPASAKHGSLPFTGTDLLVVLLAGVIALTAGMTLRRLGRT